MVESIYHVSLTAVALRIIAQSTQFQTIPSCLCLGICKTIRLINTGQCAHQGAIGQIQTAVFAKFANIIFYQSSDHIFPSVESIACICATQLQVILFIHDSGGLRGSFEMGYLPVGIWPLQPRPSSPHLYPRPRHLRQVPRHLRGRSILS